MLKVSENYVSVRGVYLTNEACCLLSLRSGVSNLVFQTFSPDKPSIFMPWTTVVGKPRSGE